MRFLANHTWGKLLLIFIGVWYDFRVWTGYLIHTTSPDNVRMKSHWWGLLDPAMTPHWARLVNPLEDFWEALKNIFSEWCRLDPERAGKVYNFLICCSVIVSMAVGILIGVLI